MCLYVLACAHMFLYLYCMLAHSHADAWPEMIRFILAAMFCAGAPGQTSAQISDPGREQRQLETLSVFQAGLRPVIHRGHEHMKTL
jgi:hypothetical protein